MRPAPPRSESDVLDAVIDEIDRHLHAVIRRHALPERLEAAVSYSAEGGGKRLRPALVLLCCEAVGGDRARALDPAAAIELVHAFSLVHDDLPAMDDDDMRRGRPTLHIQAGEAMAILAGDAMLSIAFELIAAAPFAPAHRIELVGELARATTAMIGGQVYDTLGGFPPGTAPEERLRLVHMHKTAALLSGACRMGAICGEAAPDVREYLVRYGDAIGLMFQIVDDLLDVTQSAEHLGKATGKDQSAGKLTYPGILGVDRSRAEVERLHAEARSALAPLGSTAAPLLALADDLAVRTR